MTMPSKTKNHVKNTTVEVRNDPLMGFMTAMPGGIEASEKRGQLQFVESDILPTHIQDFGGEKGSSRKIMEGWGFQFGKPLGGDSIFQQAKLPEGWKKKGSDHDMWSYILDEKGRERCSVFYKAAFYDRSAHLSLCSRYRCDRQYEDEKLRHAGRSRGIVKEGDVVLFTGEWRSNPTEGGDYIQKWGAYESSYNDAVEWFKANLPEGLVEQWARP
jgi:hypothetical protein